MLSRYKAEVSIPFNALAPWLVSLKISPNAITIAGLLLGIILCILYTISGNNLLFGVGMGFCAMLDALDGAVARNMQCSTRRGAYLDAIADRFFDVAACLAVAYRSGYWELCFLIAAGSYTVSYAKARAVMELNIAGTRGTNNDWPDFMERPERLFVFFTTIILFDVFPHWRLAGHDLLFWGLCVLNILIYSTVVQRFCRAWQLLK